MVYGKCQELITHFKPVSPISPSSGGGGQLGIGELMLAGAGAGAVTSFVLYVFYPLASSSSPSSPASCFTIYALIKLSSILPSHCFDRTSFRMLISEHQSN
jgi:hypothetical protein